MLGHKVKNYNGCAVQTYAKPTYTLAEAAKVLSCHPETLRRAIRAGQLQAAKLGRGFRISRIDLEAFWASSGGGVLFAEPLAEQKEAKQPKPSAKKENKPDGPEQLSLFFGM